MFSKVIFLALVGFLAVFSCKAANAQAPFCVEAASISPQCVYFDADACRQDAAKISGICVVNAGVVRSGGGGGLYCKVLSNGVSDCIYDDFKTCNDNAARDKSVCVRNSKKTAPPESFKFLNGVYY